MKHCMAFFLGKETEYTSLDSTKVRYTELVSRFRNKGSSDKLGECIGNIIIKHIHELVVPGFYNITCYFKIWYMVLWKVLQLYYTAGPPS
mgnify:CR=1 FL=1